MSGATLASDMNGSNIPLRVTLKINVGFCCTRIQGAPPTIDIPRRANLKRRIHEKKGHDNKERKGIFIVKGHKAKRKRAHIFLALSLLLFFRGITANQRGTDGHGHRWPSVNSSPVLSNIQIMCMTDFIIASNLYILVHYKISLIWHHNTVKPRPEAHNYGHDLF